MPRSSFFFSLHKCGLVVCVYDTTGGIPKHSTKYTLHIKSIYSKLTNFYLAVGLFFKPPKIWENIQFTMLQKLSKCEVKAWLCWNLIILPPLRIYVKSNFGKFKRSKNVIFGSFRDSEIWILLNLGLESCSNLLNSKFRTSKIAKNDIFGSFEFT